MAKSTRGTRVTIEVDRGHANASLKELKHQSSRQQDRIERYKAIVAKMRATQPPESE